MKKLQYLFMFLLCISFFSCTQELINQENCQNEENILETRRDFLYDLMEIGNYHVEEENIKEDLTTMLGEINGSDGVRAVSNIPTIEKIYESPLLESEISLFSTDEINDFEGEKTKLFVYKLKNKEKSGFAITCNDLRIGKILAIIEEGEFKKDITKEPFLQIIASNMEAYIKKTIDEWKEWDM